MRELKDIVIHECGTKKHPTLVKRVQIFRTDKPTRKGCWSFVNDWSIDGENWFKTAKEAKKGS